MTYNVIKDVELTRPLFPIQVYEFVQLAELYYAGSHGMDIMGPAKSSDGFRVKGTKCRDKKVLLLMTLSSDNFLRRMF